MLEPTKIPDKLATVLFAPLDSIIFLSLVMILPVAEIKPPVSKLPPVMLPELIRALDALSNVNAALAPNRSPSLNCTCVLAPAASMLPLMLPMKLEA